MTRTLFNAIIIALALLFPWWCGALVVLIGIWIFPRYGEAVIYGMILDALMGVPTDLLPGRVFDVSFICTLIMGLILICATLIRTRFRMRSTFYRI